MLENNPDPNELSRIELLNLARALSISDADVMTRAELRTAIEKARKPEPRPADQPVTWVSVARRLLASIVEQGLNLPDAAALIRGDTKLSTPPKAPPPVATVTLARIYAAQGHLDRAVRTLDEVLASDPDHHPAQQLRAQLDARLEEQRQAEAAKAGAAAESSAEPGPAVAPSEPGSSAEAKAAAPVVVGDGAPNHAATRALNGASDSAAEDVAAEEAAAEEADPAHPAAAMELVEHPPAQVPIHVALADAPTDVPGAHAGSVAILSPDAPEPDAAAASPAAAPAPTEKAGATELPARSPGLVIIETEQPAAYVYWELGAPPAPDASGAPCWISVVTHTPGASGTERYERRIPVYHASGALRLEGLSRHAVVRANLATSQAPDARPLAVAGSVRTKSLALAELEPCFTPHARANPQGLARRATPHLENASAVYL